MSKEEKIIKNVREKLKSVQDPEIPINIVDLGLIYDIEFDEGEINIEMTLTSMGCPTADAIVRAVETEAEGVEDVQNANAELTYDPPWKLEKHANENAKAKLRQMGIKIPNYD